MDRRTFLGHSMACGAAALGCGCVALDATPPRRIDIHHHMLPPEYLSGLGNRRFGPAPKWSPQQSIEEMDRNGVETSMISIVQPGSWLGDNAEGRRFSRLINEFGAQMVRDHRGRFGLFAAIPLPDTEGSLREIDHAFGALGARGIGLMTSYGNKWLGDPSFWPVLEELNRRKAVVYTHPTNPQCCGSLVPDLSPSTVEWTTDTTRTIASLLFSGTAVRYPDIKWIFSHGGGTMPFLIGRFETQMRMAKDVNRRLPNGPLHELRRFWYDTAQANHPGALAALTKLIPVLQIVFGSDYPLRTVVGELDPVRKYDGFSASDLRAIERDNALRLLS